MPSDVTLAGGESAWTLTAENHTAHKNVSPIVRWPGSAFGIWCSFLLIKICFENSAAFISHGVKCNKCSVPARVSDEENVSAAEHLIVATRSTDVK